MHAYGLIKTMPPHQSHLPQARSTYIPPRIQHEMNQHLQKTLPANLQYYQKSGGYVPPHIQQQMAQHMQKSMPEHLKQYINPYMQQTVVTQHLASGAAPPAHINPMTPTFGGQQTTTRFQVQPHQATQPQQVISQPQSGPLTTPPQPEAHVVQEPYAFITNPEVMPKSSSRLLSLLNGKSLTTRLAVLGGGVVGLIILLSILGRLLSASFPLQPFLVVLQDQSELMHLTTNQSQSGEAALPATYQNFLATTQATVTSAQSQLLIYLAKNKQKVSPADLRYSSSIDAQLTAAATNETYVTTYQQIMTNQLSDYKTALRQAYAETSGKKGHAQLSNDYRQLTLLIKQYDQAISAPSN